MLTPSVPFPTWSIGQTTASVSTAFAALIPPSRGAGGGPLVYKATPNYLAGWMKGPAGSYTHISQLKYTIGGTTHPVSVMRPLNWSVTSAVAAASQATLVLADDPGVYSTNYKYLTPLGLVVGGQGGTPPSQVGNNAVAGGDYVAYQYPDGTWYLDVVSSGTYAALVLTNNFAVALPAGTVLFFFGIYTDSDPATGLAQWETTPTISTNRIDLLNDAQYGGFQSLHPGDPLVVYSVNTGSQGYLNSAAGFYGQH